MSVRKAARTYQRFHGRKPTQTQSITFQVPRALAQLGLRVVAIEYESDKWNGGGDGTRAIYRHEFDRSDRLYYDPESHWLYIHGPKLKVTKAGIEH